MTKRPIVNWADLVNAEFDYATYNGVRLDRFELTTSMRLRPDDDREVFTFGVERTFELAIDGVSVLDARPELFCVYLKTPKERAG